MQHKGTLYSSIEQKLTLILTSVQDDGLPTHLKKCLYHFVEVPCWHWFINICCLCRHKLHLIQLEYKVLEDFRQDHLEIAACMTGDRS